MVGGKPGAAAIPFFEGRVSLKSRREGREAKGNGDNISALLCPRVCPGCCRGRAGGDGCRRLLVASGLVPHAAQLCRRARQAQELHSWTLYLISMPKAGHGSLWGPEICCVVFWDDRRSTQNPYFFSFSWYIMKIETACVTCTYLNSSQCFPGAETCLAWTS